MEPERTTMKKTYGTRENNNEENLWNQREQQ